MKNVNWSAIETAMTTVPWKDQTTLVGRPIKSVKPIYFCCCCHLSSLFVASWNWLLCCQSYLVAQVVDKCSHFFCVSYYMTNIIILHFHVNFVSIQTQSDSWYIFISLFPQNVYSNNHIPFYRGLPDFI